MTQKRPTLSPDQLLRIEALKIAGESAPGTEPYITDAIVSRAETYLAFLKAKETLPGFPLTYKTRRKK